MEGKTTPEDLADLGAGERGHVVVDGGRLVGSKVGSNRGVEDFVVDVADDCGHGNFAESLVGRSEDGDIVDTGDRAEDFFDLMGKDLVTAAIDEIAGATLDPDEVGVVDSRQITRPHEAIRSHSIVG